MNKLSGCTDGARWIVETALKGRSARRIEVKLADREKDRAGATSGQTSADSGR